MYLQVAWATTTEMKVVHLGHGDKDRWNQLVESAPAFCLMQTYEWGEFKETQGWTAHRLAVAADDGHLIGGAQILIRPILRGLFGAAYVPRGPILDVEAEAAMASLFSAIHQLAERSRSIFMKIEPHWEHSPAITRFMEGQGFHVSHHTNQPRTSMILDLTLEPDDLLSRMHRSTRYNIGLACRKGVTIRDGCEQDLPAFYEMLGQTSERHRFTIRPFEYYTQEWLTFHKKGLVKLLLARFEDKDIAARMAFSSGKFAADLHAASRSGFGHLKVNERLVWEAILWAKNSGCQVYDLWGIPDEIGAPGDNKGSDPDQEKRGLWGVYRFKRGFGGKVVFYAGAYDYIYRKLIYKVLVKGIFRKATIEEILHVFYH